MNFELHAAGQAIEDDGYVPLKITHPTFWIRHDAHGRQCNSVALNVLIIPNDSSIEPFVDRTTQPTPSEKCVFRVSILQSAVNH